jgi:hypothetical protein
MKDFFYNITRASGEQWFGFVVLTFCMGAAIVGITALASDHKVRCYYMQSYSTDAGIAYKIISDIDWGEDRTAFTTSDQDKMLEVISGLKQCAGNDS